MAVPDFQSLMRPCLAVHQDRKPHTPTDLRDRLAAPWVRFLPKAALWQFMVIIDDYHAAADIYSRKPAA